MKSTTFTLSLFATLALAKTDLEGCTSSETVAFGGASLIYWDPTNGEICSFLDCGGGRAPPKTTVPGCPQYAGTATYTPDFLPGWGEASATPTAAAVESQTSATEGFAQASAEASGSGSGSTLVTSAATLPVVTSAVGTGGASLSTGVVGGNNVTGTATLSSPTGSATVPVVETGAAGAFGVAQGIVGVAVGLFGLGML